MKQLKPSIMKNFWFKLSDRGEFRAEGRHGVFGGNKPILALAPMAGVTDSAFRQICRKSGADVVYTEMVSADGFFYDSKKTLEFLKFVKDERPIVIQLFGKYPEKFTKAAAAAEKAGFDGIDINFGCPAKKVAGHGGGVTLMRDLAKCRQIIEAVLAGTKLPVSVKLRSSINSSHLIRGRLGGGKNDNLTPPQPSPYEGEGVNIITALDFIKYMKGLPIAAVMIHGRSYEKPFDGDIDYKMIKSVKDFLADSKTVILGNGGIKTPEEAKTMIEKTGCDGVGLARGIYGRPWLFKQIKDYLQKGKYREPTIGDLKKIILEHARMAFRAKGEHGLIELRKHLLWYVSGFSGAKELRKQLVAVKNIDDIKNVLKQFK